MEWKHHEVLDVALPRLPESDCSVSEKTFAKEEITRQEAGLKRLGSERRVFGYARVSAQDQNLARQMIALEEFPVSKDYIFSDKASGKNFDRQGYHALLDAITPGDLLVVKSIDRLGRDYDDIQEQWRYLTKELGVDIVVLDMPLLDTRATEGGITGKFLSDMVLQVLSYVAQVERESTKQRQAEGIAAAHARGVKFGRPRKELPRNFARATEAYKAGSITRRQAASSLGVSMNTFDAWRKEKESSPSP